MFSKIFGWLFKSKESRLIGACFGDRAKASRLISYEQTKAPHISRNEAIDRAFSRLEWDRS